MKKFLLFLLMCSLMNTAFAQTTIVGDNQCTSPYCGCDKIVVQRVGVPPGEWVELIVPTNTVFTSQNGLELGTQHWSTAGDATQGWRQANASGVVTFEFNASLSDEVVNATVANGWLLAAGPYVLTTRFLSDRTGASVQSVPFFIIGTDTQAVKTAAKNKGKGKSK